MPDEERQMYLTEIVRLNGIIDRVRASRRRPFVVGRIRPVRDHLKTFNHTEDSRGETAEAPSEVVGITVDAYPGSLAGRSTETVH